MKTIDLRWSAAALALFAAACDKTPTAGTPATGPSTAAAPIPAANGQDWTETVSATPEGGFVMGNPAAPAKVVEYASLTCPHCADFSMNSAPKLREAVKGGKVSWEFRNFILNPIDVAATLLARCQGAQPFFPLVEQTFAEQANWAKTAMALSEAEQQRIGALPEQQQFVELGKATGLIDFYAARGLPAAKAQACLADKAALDQLLQIRDRGSNQDRITGTPGFVVNGKLAEGAYDWNTLKPVIDAAGG